MEQTREAPCPDCGGMSRYYDSVRRLVRTKARKARHVRVPRFACPDCGRIHRRLPDYILPYKQYEADIVHGVASGLITCETYGYEDYPCEATMVRWRGTEGLHG